MAKNDKSNEKIWTPAELNELIKLAQQKTPTRIIAFKLGRTPANVQTKALAESISLK